ncbi:MAG: hypothetical protein IJK81_13605 [Selenomonadaceae bacterium]|nr:hypothetical protein [Selenomonadaceae bacterium]
MKNTTELTDLIQRTMQVHKMIGVVAIKDEAGTETLAEGNCIEIAECLLELLASIRDGFDQESYSEFLAILCAWLNERSKKEYPLESGERNQQ